MVYKQILQLDGVYYPGLPVACYWGVQLIFKWSLGEMKNKIRELRKKMGYGRKI
jgi:hypothetical protein